MAAQRRQKKTSKKPTSRRGTAAKGKGVRRAKAASSRRGAGKARPPAQRAKPRTDSKLTDKEIDERLAGKSPTRRAKPRAGGKPSDKEMGKQRIQKVLGRFGIASRRAVEEMVVEGRISVNGRVIGTLPCFVDPAVDEIRLDGRTLRIGAETHSVYYLLNKPRGVVCTQSDPAGRPRAVDLAPPDAGRVYCVGRLDVESTGLIILTNDGELTEYLTHPRHGVMKTYVVEVEGRVEGEQIETLKKGMYIDGKRTQGAWVKVLRRHPKTPSLEIRLTEGRNREIRRLLARLGNKVRRLKRTAIGPLTDRGLKIGNVRLLRHSEVRRLRTCGRPVERKTTRKR